MHPLFGIDLDTHAFIALFIAAVSLVDPLPVAPKSLTLITGSPKFARAEDATVAPVPPADMDSGLCAYTVLQAAIQAATRTKYIDPHFTQAPANQACLMGHDFRLNMARFMSSKCLSNVS